MITSSYYYYCPSRSLAKRDNSTISEYERYIIYYGAGDTAVFQPVRILRASYVVRATKYRDVPAESQNIINPPQRHRFRV